MSDLLNKLQSISAHKEHSVIHVQTMGGFVVWRNKLPIDNKEWGRDKTIQLFQFLISARHRHGLHKEQIIDRLWEDASDRDFKVALHGINKVLEPNRPARTDSKYIIRQGLSYHLDISTIWIDIEALEQYIIVGNQSLTTDPSLSKIAYRNAIDLHNGLYLPDRMYEDWSSEERERSQVLILGTYISLAELLIDENPMECIRLAQCAISIDPCWEDAYRIQMQAYINKGNRPQAIKTFQICHKVLDREYGIEPLPETKNLLREINAL